MRELLGFLVVVGLLCLVAAFGPNRESHPSPNVTWRVCETDAQCERAILVNGQWLFPQVKK